MKKRVLISLFCVLLLSGCGCTANSKEAVMKEYATDYYKKFMKDYIEGADVAEVNIEMLENANKSKKTSYDLKKLEGCTSSSKVIFTLKSNSNDIKSTDYKLNCK